MQTYGEPLMESLHLELLGTVQFRLGNKPLTGFTTMKAKALLIYLVVTQSPYSRDELAALFWRDMPETQAKKKSPQYLAELTNARRTASDYHPAHGRAQLRLSLFDRCRQLSRCFDTFSIHDGFAGSQRRDSSISQRFSHRLLCS